MTQDPSVRASDLEQMMPKWAKVSAILGGIDVMRTKAATYLPQMPAESDKKYKFRVSVSKMTNVFEDIVENLASRAFAKKVTLADEGTDKDFEEFEADVDGRGNSLHVFASQMFHDGIAYGVDFILVDYQSNVPENATIAQEKALGLRPYWVRYPVENVLAAHTAIVDGREQFVHVRLLEITKELSGFEEKTVERVRVIERQELPSDENGNKQFGPPVVALWEKKRNETNQKIEWVKGPSQRLTIGEIPFFFFITSRRKSKGWNMKPPMQNAADLQITLFQQESDLEYAKVSTAFPMLAGNGIAPAIGDDGSPAPLETGPGVVLYAPPSGEGGNPSWDILEPGASSLSFLAGDIKTTISELRELGRQPLTAQSGNLTRVTTAYAAQKGNTAVEAWGMAAKDALEHGLYLTGLWFKSDVDPKVQMDLDFDLSFREDDGFDAVLSLRDNGEISREQTLHEAKRRNILDRDYDPEDDAEKLLDEIEDDDDDDQSPDGPPGQQGEDDAE